MTNQEAAKILRTENLGDSELMELAKKMGADALERQKLSFVSPVCGHCGYNLLGLRIRYDEVIQHKNLAAATNIDPPCCPRCKTFFTRVDIDFEKQICTAQGEEGQT